MIDNETGFILYCFIENASLFTYVHNRSCEQFLIRDAARKKEHFPVRLWIHISNYFILLPIE